VGTSFGCYGGGFLSPLAGPCAIIETHGTTNGITVSRHVFVVEASSTGFKDAVLDVYVKQDVISGGGDTPSMSLIRRIDLGLKVGLKTACFMAGGPRYLFIATALSSRAVLYDKVTGRVAPEGVVSSPPIPVTQITADERGFVTVSHQNAQNTSITVYDPNGKAVQDGGGTGFMANVLTGTKPQ